MILEYIFNIIIDFISYIFNLLPNLPDFPSNISNSINSYLDLIFNNAGLVGLFIPLSLTRILLALTISLVGFKLLYDLIMWVVRKIPFLGME